MTVARTNTIQILYSDTDNTDAPSAQTAPLSLSEGELCWQDQGTVGTNGKLWIGDAASGAEFHIGGAGTGAVAGDASNLTGTTLASGVTASSLTSLGTIASLGVTSITMDSSTVTGIDEGTAFTDADDHLMTSGAIKEKIEDYGYGTGSSSSDNVSTALQIGTASSTVVNITSDGGADDVTIPTATTTVAGVMSSAIFDEVAANTLKVTNTNATRGSLNIDTDDSVTFAGVSSTGLITATHGSGILIKDGTASSATEGGNLQLASDDNGALGIGHRLGVIEFAASEGTSDTLIVGAKIQAVADTAWTTSENGTRLELYTMDANAASELTLTLDSNQLATFAAGITMSGTLSGATLAGGTF